MSKKNCRHCNLVNFAGETYCRRCGSELAPKKNPGRSFVPGSGLYFSSMVKVLLLALAGGIVYFSYVTYREESQKIANQQLRLKEEQERIKNSYVNSIKADVKKNVAPTP